ncbi:MAG: hypothetical protein OQK12_01740 [Motiliproteus sp.]|nr:hypothetical protein [Motiliproteus sp.]MCW9053988.1 hypothetical protein [Motiliproteus sp.]
MKGELKQMAIAEIEVGAKVATNVLDSSGNLLVPEGTELSEKMLQILDRRGIETIEVRAEVELTEEERQQLLGEIQERLDHQFRGTESSASSIEFKEMLFRYHTREI